MARKLYNDENIMAIANAVRNKNGSTDTYKVSELAGAINDIPTGIDTSDATATADDIINPKTAYVNGQEVVGNIATIYETSGLETQPRGITSSIYQHIFDYNPDYHIVLAADSYNPTIMYVLKEEDGVVGNIVETISTQALGESSDYTIYDAKIAHITNEDNTINIWFTYGTMSLRVAKLDINNLTLVSYSNVCTISMNTSQTIAVNPANPNVVFWVSGKKGGSSNLFDYLVIGFAQLEGSNISISYNRECTSVGYYENMFTFASTNISWSPDGKYVSYKTYLSMSTYFYGWFSELYYCSDSTSYVSDNITRILYNSNNNKKMDIGTNITATGNYSTTFISDDLVIFVGKLVRLYKENFTELKSLSYTTNPKLAGFNNYLFEFHDNGNVYVKLYDEETNDFIIKFSNSWGAYNENNQTTLKTPKSYNDYVLYNYNDAQINIWTNGISQIIKTLIRQDRTYINTTDSTAESEDILKGKTAYINNKKVKGTMPNNGQLSYEVNDSEQTIPSGYTSGGIISAADITKLNDYKSCLRLSQLILGNIGPYTQLNYIESTGTQYILTTANTGICKYIEAEFTPTELKNSWQSYISSNVDTFTLGAKSSNIDEAYLRFNGTEIFKGNNISTSSKNTILIKDSNIYLNGTKVGTNSNNLGTGTLSIFTATNNIDGRKSAMKLYSLKIGKSESDLLLDLIPVIRNSDGKICLYDRINNTYLTNTGTGVFISGGEKQ